VSGGRSLGLIAFALVVALVAGCGGDNDETTATDAAETTATAATGPTGPTGSTGAPFEALAGTGEVPVDGAPDPELTVLEVSEQLPFPDAIADDEGFKQSLDILLAASHKYFAESIELLGEAYHLPDEFIAYDGADGDKGPDCGGAPAGVQNAAYCRDPTVSDYGIITWDETGLLQPLYSDLGDGSTAFIVGHEFAHLTQDRLGFIQKFPLTVEKELNADCLTGSLWGDFGDAGVKYTRRDINSILSGIQVVGDAPGTKWQDIHAHGYADERTDAFLLGFENGFEDCVEQYAPGFSDGKRPG
jgi:hypothetical protein